MNQIPPFPPTEGVVPVDAPALEALLRPDEGRSRFFTRPGPAWTDAMVTRTRRHVSGCVTAVEMGFAVALADAVPAAALDALSQGHVWQAIDKRPDLLSEGLLAHFRTRAAFSLMMAPGGRADPALGTMDAALQAHCDGLALALARWTGPGAEGTPMRADLPAEAMEELVWAVAGRMAAALRPLGAVPYAQLLAAIDAAGQSMLAGYDEQAAPVGAATLIARLIDRSADAAFDPAVLVEQGHYLLLCALVAGRCGLETADVAHVIVHHREAEPVRLLCHAAGFDPVIAPLLLLALRPARAVPADEALGEMAGNALPLHPDEALAQLAGLRVAGGFRAALARDAVWIPERIG